MLGGKWRQTLTCPRTKLGGGHSGLQGRVQKVKQTPQGSRMFLLLTEGCGLRFSTWMAFPQNPSGSEVLLEKGHKGSQGLKRTPVADLHEATC